MSSESRPKKADDARPVWVRPSMPPQASGSQASAEWWAAAYLFRGERKTYTKPTQIGYGSLAEMIAQALSRPMSERERLYIETDLGAAKLTWHEIVTLAARSDCPVII